MDYANKKLLKRYVLTGFIFGLVALSLVLGARSSPQEKERYSISQTPFKVERKPTPTMEPATPQPIIRQAPVLASAIKAKGGLVITNPIEIHLEGRNGIAQLDNTTGFVVFRIPDNQEQIGTITLNTATGRVYFKDEPGLESLLIEEYRHNCQDWGKCDWIEYTFDPESNSVPSIDRGKREDLLK